MSTKKNIGGAIFMVALMMTSCHHSGVEGLSDRDSPALFVSVADLLNSYDSQENGTLDSFDGLILGKTTFNEVASILAPRGYSLSLMQGFDDDTEDLYYEGKLGDIDIEYGLYFNNSILSSIAFSIEDHDKVSFMRWISNLYGRPIFDEEKSNSYIWYFTNSAIVFHQRETEGLVEIHLFSTIHEGLQ